MSTLAVLHEGQWKAVEIVGIGQGGSLQAARLNESYVDITTTGSSVSPKIELIAGSSASVHWIDLGSGRSVGVGTNPTIAFGSGGTRHIGFRVEDHGVEAFDHVLTLNLGFDYTQDSGIYNIGAGYNYTPQSVSGVANLQLLSSLKRFLAANTNLTGHLDVSGLSHLEFIECFHAKVTSVDLTDCTSLIRLCMESNHLTQLDLNPVRHNLFDLRAAVQYEGESSGPYSLTFAPLVGQMDNLYHYCIRDQMVYNLIPHAQLPVIQQCWTWNTGQTSIDTPVSPVLNSYLSYGNNYDQNSVNRIMVGLDTNGPSGGTVDISSGSSPAPSGAGATAKSSLQGKGWTVTTN